MAKKQSKFHGNQTPKAFSPLSTSVTTNAWRKVSKAGNYDNWIDYQKRVLGQVTPIKKYKKGI
jgi:surface antigen